MYKKTPYNTGIGINLRTNSRENFWGANPWGKPWGQILEMNSDNSYIVICGAILTGLLC